MNMVGKKGYKRNWKYGVQAQEAGGYGEKKTSKQPIRREREEM
jgi:hypothetical protein